MSSMKKKKKGRRRREEKFCRGAVSFRFTTYMATSPLYHCAEHGKKICRRRRRGHRNQKKTADWRRKGSMERRSR